MIIDVLEALLQFFKVDILLHVGCKRKLPNSNSVTTGHVLTYMFVEMTLFVRRSFGLSRCLLRTRLYGVWMVLRLFDICLSQRLYGVVPLILVFGELLPKTHKGRRAVSFYSEACLLVIRNSGEVFDSNQSP